MKRDILSSPRIQEIKKRRQKVLFRKMIFFGIVLVFVFGIFTYISSLPKLNINNIEVVGNKITDTELIKGVIQEELAGKYIFLFPKSNIFFYPKNKIKEKLAENFKRLVNINLSIKDENTLEVTTEERKGVYVWCGENTPTAEISTTEECFFMDEGGYIFDVAPYFSGDVYFKFYGKVTDNPNPIGSYFVKSDFNRIISLKEMLENINIDPASLYKSQDENMKIYLSSKSVSPLGPEILIKIDSDFQKIVENLQSALTTEPLLTDFKKKYSSLLYLDLRFGNKVYFKFK